MFYTYVQNFDVMDMVRRNQPCSTSDFRAVAIGWGSSSEPARRVNPSHRRRRRRPGPGAATGADPEIGSFPSSLPSHAPRLKTEEIDRAAKAQFDNQSWKMPDNASVLRRRAPKTGVQLQLEVGDQPPILLGQN